MECNCFWVDEKYWFTYYGIVEPGSQREWNPDCLIHWEHIDDAPIYRSLING